MSFREWEEELEALVRDELGVDLAETGYDRSLARACCRAGDSPRDFMEANVASPDALDERDIDVERELGVRSA